MAGRVTGTGGASGAAFYISRQFKHCGLQVDVDSFSCGDRVGHNVTGFLLKPGAAGYVVVMAHYDGAGSKCSGADSNASGVAALLALARARDFSKLGYNVIFAALDGHYDKNAGARRLWSQLAGNGIGRRQIALVVNLDILGSTLSPPQKNKKDFLIVLGGDRFADLIYDCNYDTRLRLYTDYYGSEQFTRLFYRKASDHCIFLDNGVPCLMFTSGITMNTNRDTDTSETLDYEVFARRVALAGRVLESFKDYK